jgi:hypothetical protein
MAQLLTLAACGGGGAASTTPRATCASAPASPTGLVASSVTATGIVLSWGATTPPLCTLSFTVYRDGLSVANGVMTTAASVTGLSASNSYVFTVAASDAFGSSSQSAPLNVTTSAGGTLANGVTLTGKLIWHSYTTYGFAGVQSWMANFDSGEIREITAPRLLGAMNYHFSPDGTTVVVMADDNGITAANGTTAWDLWVASVTDTGLMNITKITNAAIDGSRNEDPKFSSDGSRIIFKRNLTNIATIDVAAIAVNGVDQTPPQTILLSSPTEVSMPYFLVGSSASFLYADDASQSIRFSANGQITTLYSLGTHSYYPIAVDATQFYFVAGQGNDLLYHGATDGGPAATAAFINNSNNTSEFADPFPFGSNWLAYTSTVAGGAGAYDLWIGNFATGQAFRLDSWIRGANHGNSDLGPTFHGTLSP